MSAIAVNLLCVRCGYNLRGMTVNATCPECGTSVAKSDTPDRLIYARPEFLHDMIGGLENLLASGPLAIALLAAAVALMTQIEPPEWIAALLAWSSLMPAVALHTRGWWRLTNQPLGQPEDEPARWARLVTRACASNAGLIAFLWMPAMLLDDDLVGVLFLLMVCVVAVGALSALAYAHTLAGRAPSRTLLKWLRGLIALALVVVGSIIGLILAVYADSSFRAHYDSPAEWAIRTATGILGVLIFLGTGLGVIYAIAMMLAYRFTLQRVLTLQQT